MPATLDRPLRQAAGDDVAAEHRHSTTQIADSGASVAVVGPGLHRLAGGAEVCGPAVTVWTTPGDILFVVPRDHLAAVVAASRGVADRETAWRAAIAGGRSLPSATGIDDLLAALHDGQEPPLP